MLKSKWKKVPVRIIVDKQRKNVICVECKNDFVDILFSFLTLPLGTINILLGKKFPKNGFYELYERIMNLDRVYLETEACKNMMFQPKSKSSMFLVTNNLEVTPLDGSKIQAALNNYRNSRLFHTIDVEVGREEIFYLLERSLISKSPLSDVFLRPKYTKLLRFFVRPRLPKTSLSDVLLWSKFAGVYYVEKLMRTTPELDNKRHSNNIGMKLLLNDYEVYSKGSYNSFLTLPIGFIIKLLDDKRSSVVDVFTNLHRSVEAFCNVAEKNGDPRIGASENVEIFYDVPQCF